MKRIKSKNHNHLPFHYFHKPHCYSYYSKTRKKCEICGQNSSGYESGALYGVPDICTEINFICEKCLIEGKLRQIGCMTNLGNPKILREQLRNSLQLTRPFPKLPEQDIEKLIKERSEEIEYRTPQVSSWQDFDWPVHCGDYCCFIGEMGKEELSALSPDKDGRVLLNAVIFDMTWVDSLKEKEMSKERLDRIHKEATEYLDWLWEYIPSHAPRGKRDSSSPILLFQCLRCNNYLGILDFD